MKKKKRFCYEYPRPALTVDVVLFRGAGKAREILLICRKSDPFKGRWALPGGFVDEGEKLVQAAKRELQEETGIRVRTLEQMGAFGDPGRDPREHTVSVVFTGTAPSRAVPRGGDDAADAAWFAVEKLPPLAFDHRKIIRQALQESGSAR